MLRIRSFLAVVALALLPTALFAQTKGVHVSGEGQIKVAADLVTVTIGMETIDDELVRVRQTSDKQAQTILAHLKKQGAPDGNFQVTALRLTFGYSEQLKRQIYKVQRDVTLELGDIAKLDALLADLLKEPFVKIGGITFRTSKQRELEMAARAKAMADALTKARQLAELSGLRLGKAYNIQVISEREVPFAASAMPAPSAAYPAPAALPRAIESRRRESTPVGFAPADDTTQVQAAAEAKAFGIGEIVIAAEVRVDFELE